MILIDKEKLLNKLQKQYFLQPEEIIKEIEFSSPVDAKPIIESHWHQEKSGWVYCEHCSHRAYHIEWLNINTDLSPNYCPNCGAQILEEAADDKD